MTSDIDQTYLGTEIDTTRGKARTLFETHREKRILPGMTTLYKSVREFQAGNKNPFFLKFISASPFFFRRIMGQIFRKERLEYDSVHLKDLQGILNNMFFDSLANLSNFNAILERGKPSWQRAAKFLEPYFHNFFDQTGYKLILLLKNRLSYPVGTREILVGDNTESDFLIFALYKKILEEEEQPEDWVKFFQDFMHEGKRVLTQKQVSVIVKLIIRVREYINIPRPVVPLIMIHKASPTMDSQKIQDMYGRHQLPYKVTAGFENTGREIYLCDNALHMAEVLVEHGFLKSTATEEVQKAMMGKALRNQVFDQNYFRLRLRQREKQS